MEGAKVIYAAERFIERGNQPGDPTLETNAHVYYIDERRNERDETIEDIVKQSATDLAVILESHGYEEEAIELRERALQFAREGTPPQVIYEIFEQYINDEHPDLLQSLTIMNR